MAYTSDLLVPVRPLLLESIWHWISQWINPLMKGEPFQPYQCTTTDHTEYQAANKWAAERYFMFKPHRSICNSFVFNLTWKSWNYFCIMYSCNTLLFLWENILLWYSQVSSKWLHLSEMMYFTLNCNIASRLKISTLISLLWQHKEKLAFGVWKWAGDNRNIFLKFSISSPL